MIVGMVAAFAFYGCTMRPTTAPTKNESTNSTNVSSSSDMVFPDNNGLPAFGELKYKYFEHQLIVGYNDKSAVETIAKILKAKVKDELPKLKAVLLEFDSTVKEAYRLLKMKRKELRGIRFIEPNYDRALEPIIKPTEEEIKAIKHGVRTSSSSSEDDEWMVYQWALRVLGASDVWDTATGTGVIVAVLDTGVDGTHPDLQGQIVEGYDPYTWEIIDPNEDSDTYGHGTHVAGIIAGKKGGGKIRGLAYEAKIMPIRIFRPYYVGDWCVADGIRWAVDHGADVLSNSWGGPGYSYILKAAFDYAMANNVVVVAAAGNGHTDQHWHYPSAFTGIIAVSASTARDEITSWSSRGDYISVAAPGSIILSSIPVRSSEEEGINGEPYAYWSGTSMATPYVSALVALLKQKYPQATPYQIRKMIESSAKDIEEPGYDTASGFGRISPASALELQPNAFSNESVLLAKAVDRDGRPLYGVYVTIENKETGKRYYEKACTYYYDEEAGYETPIAIFLRIEPGEYKVIYGGPDFLPWDSRNWRVEEELSYSTDVTISAFDGTTTVYEGTPTFVTQIYKSSFDVSSVKASCDFEGTLTVMLKWSDYYSDDSEIIATEVLNSTSDSADFVLSDGASSGHYFILYTFEGTMNSAVFANYEFDNGFGSDWTLGGDAMPFIVYLEEEDATVVQFGDIDDNEVSYFETNVSLEKDAQLSFKYKVSSEQNWDYFKVYIDGQLVYEDSGETGWKVESIPVSSGEHTIRFAYEKDSSMSQGEDTAWVDWVKIEEFSGLTGKVNINGNEIDVYSEIPSGYHEEYMGVVDEYGGRFAPWTVF